MLAAIDARSKEPFTDGTTHFPSTHCIRIVYDGTREGSAARRLLVKFYTDFNVQGLLGTKPEDVPHDFLHDLAISLMAHRPLLQEFNDLKDESTRNETDYRNQIAIKEGTLEAQKQLLEAQKAKLTQKEADYNNQIATNEALRGSIANLEAQKQSLEGQKSKRKKQLNVYDALEPLK